MTNFNVKEDQKMNQLAVDYARGDMEAGNDFIELVTPKLRSFAKTQKKKTGTDMELEDIEQDFLMKAIEMTYKFEERYNDGKSNIMPIIYTSCRNKFQDDSDAQNLTQKRARKVEVGGETVNRVVSLSTPIGEDGNSTLMDVVSHEQVSVEDQVVNSRNEEKVSEVVEQFVGNAKGRNATIIPIIYTSTKENWSNDDTWDAISQVLEAEKGIVPSNATIRQAKSRALKAMRKSIEAGQVTLANQLEWE